MDKNSNEDAAAVIVIDPIYDDRHRDNANEKINDVDDVEIPQLVVVAAFSEKQWQVPRSPKKSKQHGSGKEIEVGPQAVDAISPPAELFQHGCQKKGEQYP